MKYIFELLDRDTLLAVMNSMYQSYVLSNKPQTVQSYEKRVDLKCAMYVFLKKYPIRTNEVPMFKHVLIKKDIEVIKHLNRYNYNKLKLHSL